MEERLECGGREVWCQLAGFGHRFVDDSFEPNELVCLQHNDSGSLGRRAPVAASAKEKRREGIAG